MRRNPIARRFSITVFIALGIIGFLYSLIDGFFNYRGEMIDVQEEIEQIHESHIPLIVTSLWLTDYPMLQSEVDAVNRFPYVVKAEVIDDEGTIFLSGDSDVEGAVLHSHPLEYHYKEKDIPVGELVIYVDLCQIREISIIEGLIVFGQNLLTGGIMILVTIILFQRMIGKHLQHLAASVIGEDISSFDTPIRLQRNHEYDDELQYLTVSLNDLRSMVKQSFDNKNLLLREVHHRIKNNMNSMGLLLNLQADELENREAKSVLLDAEGRIRSMIVLYDKLYRNTNVESISVREYLPSLVDEVSDLYSVNIPVTIKKEIADIVLPFSKLNSLGLLVNELLTNSLKHAFIGRDQGTISISFQADSAKHMIFKYHDDGVGLQEDDEGKNKSSLGMILIQNMSLQMDGSYSIYSESGFHFTLEFML